jgi:glycine/D-amino acid oxidase-like deaminating enzyme/nitrite reductase/ring-hydroxylating ferredoxin subunit
MPSPSALREDLRADICVVGAGIAGLTTAYLLADAGLSVAVIDGGPLAGGETARTTAHLTHAIDDRYYAIERLHGERGARLAAESHTAAIDRIEAIANAEGIACDFERVDGFLFAPPDGSQEELERELEAARRAGLTHVTRVERAPFPHFDTGPCLRFPRQAQFHPLRYLAGLARAIERRGGRLFTGTHASSIEGGKNGSPGRVATQAGPVLTARAIVVATNTPVQDVVTIHTKQAAYRTYVIGAHVPRGSVPFALYWDTLDPYHYVRLAHANGSNADLLLVGGEDHKVGQAEDETDRLSRLEAWARERVPNIQGVAYRWSGQVMEPHDGVAFIGRNPSGPENVYIATGDSGMGMTHGTIAGILLTDLIRGIANHWSELYDPSRKPVRAIKEFVKENINFAIQYADWITPGEVSSPDEIPPGSGALIRHGLTKRAVYRDASGVLHERSAVCPHLGCIVQWNDLEKSWDCPCHGSRFSAEGRVLNGPAIGDLPAVDGG